MINNIILATLLAIVVVVYWIICRRKAFKYQLAAATHMKEYFKDGQVSDSDKESLYVAYVLLRKWFMLPLFAIATPFILIYLVILNGNASVKPAGRGNQELYNKAFDQMMKMAISKNPLLSSCSIALVGISFALVIPLGLLLSRFKSMPNPDAVANVFKRVSLKLSHIAHHH